MLKEKFHLESFMCSFEKKNWISNLSLNWTLKILNVISLKFLTYREHLLQYSYSKRWWCCTCHFSNDFLIISVRLSKLKVIIRKTINTLWFIYVDCCFPTKNSLKKNEQAKLYIFLLFYWLAFFFLLKYIWPTNITNITE